MTSYMHQIADFVDGQSLPVFPYRLLTEISGMAYRYDLGDVLAIVVSQLIEGRTVVVMPPVRPVVLSEPQEGAEQFQQQPPWGA